jgi:hypothetical protein
MRKEDRKTLKGKRKKEKQRNRIPNYDKEFFEWIDLMNKAKAWHNPCG